MGNQHQTMGVMIEVAGLVITLTLYPRLDLKRYPAAIKKKLQSMAYRDAD